jgi:phenylpropionate dioxygenase-like ring-hydroxylating dioxygenase large terminal subunit
MESELSASQEAPAGAWPRYTAAGLGFRNYWYPVLFARSLREKPRTITLCGERLVLCRNRGPGEKLVVFRYGDQLRGRNVTPYPVAERAGLIWVYIGDAPAPPVEDDIPEELLRPDTVMIGAIELRQGNWRHAIENCIDEGHAKYLHRTALSQLFKEMPAWTEGVSMAPSTDGRWLSRVRGQTIAVDEYPRIGRWPRKRFWKRQLKGQPTELDTRLPCLCRVGGPARGWTAYEYFVPVDGNRHRALILAVIHARGLDAVRFRLKYWLNIYWLHYWFFNRSQDQRMVALMDCPPERLYRPDRSITGWRRWAHETARQTSPAAGAPGAPRVAEALVGSGFPPGDRSA